MTSYRFHAPEYYHRHKTSDWYWMVGIVAVSAIAVAVIFNNILFAILIALGAFSLCMHAARQPDVREVEISDAGVTVGNYRFSYANLESFWIEHEAHATHGRMLIKTNRALNPHIIVPVSHISEEEKEELREFLKSKLPEVEQTEPLLEQIMEYLGF